MSEAEIEKSLQEAKAARAKAEEALAASKALEGRLAQMLTAWKLARADQNRGPGEPA